MELMTQKAKWLKYRGHLANISQNMLEGAVNGFTGETGHGTNFFSGATHVKFPDLAAFYKENAGGFVIIGVVVAWVRLHGNCMVCPL